MNIAKCGHCDKIVPYLLVESLDIQTAMIAPVQKYKGVTYSCPYCHAVLSASMDQIALSADVASRVLKALGKG